MKYHRVLVRTKNCFQCLHNKKSNFKVSLKTTPMIRVCKIGEFCRVYNPQKDYRALKKA